MSGLIYPRRKYCTGIEMIQTRVSHISLKLLEIIYWCTHFLMLHLLVVGVVFFFLCIALILIFYRTIKTCFIQTNRRVTLANAWA